MATERRGATLVVTIDRPERHNAVDAATAAALEAAARRFAAADDLAVMVLTGRGERAFCAGADLADAGALLAREGAERSGPMGFTRLPPPEKPVVAAVEGYCLAGGLEIALWADFRVAGAGARFGVTNRRFGVPLIDGGTQRLPRLVGLGNALYLIETGALVGARRAREMGLVQEVVPAGEALARALALADAMAGSPRRALLADRQAALEGRDLPLDAGLAREWALHQRTLADPEMPAAIARFLGGQADPPLEAAPDPDEAG